MYRISKGRIQSAVGLLAALLLVGCSGYQVREDHNISDTPMVSKGATLSAEVSGFLSSGAGESTRYFASTYWGDNVELTTEPTYYAASGRNCRQVSVGTMSGSSSNQWLACEGGNGQWVAVKPLR